MNRKKIYPTYMIILPLIVFGIFFVLPSTLGYLYAFTDWSAYVPDPKFIGIQNFIDVMTEKTVPIAFVNTLIFAGVKTVIVTVLGFVFALALNRKLKTRNALRTLYFIPAIFCTLIVGLIFNALFGGRHGAVNMMLSSVGLKELCLPWLGERWPAVFVITLCEIWRSLGHGIIITLAGLQSVPDEYLEAAKVDGASGWNLFRHITLPLIMPTVNVNILFSLIFGLKMFDLVYFLTLGGPGHDTETFGTLIMNEMANGRYSHSVATNLIFTVILVIEAILFQKFSARWEHVE